MSRVTFTSNAQAPALGDWQGICFRATSVDAVFDADYNYVSGCTIQYADITFGGSLLGDQSSPYIAHNYISYNEAKYWTNWNFGIVGVQQTSMRIIDNVIEYNQGDGIKVGCCSSLVAMHNTIRGNVCNERGGAIVCESPCTLQDNMMIGNTCGQAGAIEASGGGGHVLDNNLIANNSGQTDIVRLSSSVTLANNTVIGNIGPKTLDLQASADNIYAGNNILGNTADYAIYLEPGATADVTAQGNYWGTTDTDLIDDQIWDWNDDWHLGHVLYDPISAQPTTGTYPFLWQFATSPVSPVSTGPVDLVLGFSAPMRTTVQPTVTFGMDPTYDTHVVTGEWVSATQWVGNYDVTYYTGDGIQRLRVAGAVRAEGSAEIAEDTRFTFEIATVGAVSINAEPGYDYVDLSWPASDLVTTAGYNLYRSTQSGGPYTRLNDTLLTTLAYHDAAVTNGTTYYYLVRLLTTDLYELDYGDETAATPNDYSPPTRPAVTDDGTCTPYTNQLHATWSSSDPESGISEYQYSIGTWAGGTDVINWTSAGTSIEITRTGLSLIEGVTYYFNAKARNGAGTWSQVSSSDGILVSSGCPAVDFTASPRSGCRPLQVQFTNQTVGSAVSYSWNFGDGASSTVANPQHTYVTTGSFTVTLTVTGTTDTNSRDKPAYITVWEKHTIYLPLVLRSH